MFITENVAALFKKGTLKLVADDDGYRRIAEATLVIEPFTPALARELGEDIAWHLFTDDDEIRDELDAIDLRVRVGMQAVTVKRHQDLDPLALLSPVAIQDVTAKRCEKKGIADWLALSFVLVFSLEDKEARAFVLDEFGLPLCWTFAAMQRDLLEQADVLDAVASLGEGGSATLTTPEGDVVRFDHETAKKHRGAAKKLRGQAETAMRARRTH